MALGSGEVNSGGFARDADGRLLVVSQSEAGAAGMQGQAGTATLTNVASSGSTLTLLSANTNRLGAYIYNDSTQVLYVKFGTTASNSSYTVQIPASGYYELPKPVYTGRIDGIWASANGNARITEITA